MNYIKEFKEEHYRKVMKENNYSIYLFVNKVKDEKFGICGWIAKFYLKYKISIRDKNYEQKLFYCHLTDDKKNFNLINQELNLIFYLYFLKKNIFIIINIIYQQLILFNLKENIQMK